MAAQENTTSSRRRCPPSRQQCTRGKWDLARVTDVFPGPDGVVRNVQVKTSKGEYKRSIQKCCPLIEKDGCT